MKKVILFFALAGIMTMNSLRAQNVIASGDCGANGNNLTWVLTSDSVLTINGSGKMKDYSNRTSYSWYSYSNQIKTLIIGDSVTTIGTNAFYSMSLTDSLVIPLGVIGIGANAFRSCKGLTSLTLPAGLNAILHDAFSNCSGLTLLTCLASTPPQLGPSAFWDVPNTIPVCVPSGSVAAYQSSAWNSYFTNISGCAPVGIAEAGGEKAAITVYPNPVGDVLYIQSSTADYLRHQRKNAKTDT